LARKILLADDSVTAQNMGRKILADAGYDVITVNNGSAALKRINELKPDLIVLDVYMPGYSGLEVCQRIKEQDETAHIPVLLTVGKLEPFKPEEARRVRADAHIVKPFEASELLTAITKLEDRMVPQQAEGSRFSSSSAGVERFDSASGSGSGGGSRKSESKTEIDSGWKNRIRFPAKKKKEEPEPEPEDVAAAAGATFRDFRKGKGKTTSGVFAVNGPAAEQESQVVPDIPRDITPEELDALSAVAAKLDAPAPAASLGETAPIAEKAVAEKAAAEKKVAHEPAAVAKAQDDSNLAALTGPEVETPSAGVEHAEPEHAGPAMQAVEVEASTVADAKAAAQVYAEQLQNVADDSASTEPEVAPDRRKARDRRKAEVAEPEVVKPQVVKTEVAESHVSETGYSEPAAAEAVVGNSAVPAQESPSSSASSSPSTSLASPSSSAEPDDEKIEAAPSEAELTEALRLLTPSTGTANVATSPSNGNAAHSQLLSDEVTGNPSTDPSSGGPSSGGPSSGGPSSGGPRWIADAVALSAEEAAMSLEAEMFRTFATMPTTTDASGPATPSSSELAPERIIGVSAIAAAVESRMAAAGMASGTETWSSQHSRSMENAAAEAAAALEASAELLAAASAATPVVDLIGAEVERKIVAEAAEAEKKHSQAKAAEEAPAEEFASATFADAMGKNEIEAAAEATVDAAVDATEQNQDSNTEVGGQDSMGKNGKTKSEKSNLQETQAAPANVMAVADNSPGTAQPTAPVAEEAPKAMAAAADSSASANDARTIANIVDSVMADLRPRIVEEIAKKLAGK
jgi:CheY-like chemotaxis protein